MNDLKIVDAAANSMAERMQNYINEGTFTEKELERQEKALDISKAGIRKYTQFIIGDAEGSSFPRLFEEFKK